MTDDKTNRDISRETAKKLFAAGDAAYEAAKAAEEAAAAAYKEGWAAYKAGENIETHLESLTPASFFEESEVFAAAALAAAEDATAEAHAAKAEALAACKEGLAL